MKKTLPIPKDSASFFRARALYPASFKFTEEGNLAVPSIRDQPEAVIELPRYRAATATEYEEHRKAREAELDQLETLFDSTMEEYLQALTVYRETGIITEVFRLHRELSRLDIQRSALRSPLRWINDKKKMTIRDIFPDKHYEVKKMEHAVFQFRDFKDTFEERVKVRTAEDDAAEAAAAAEAEGGAATGVVGGEGEGGVEEEFLFFDDPTDESTGYLSPDYTVEFVYNSIKYTSLLQAYEVERAVAIGRPDVKPLLLKTRSIKTIRTISQGMKGDVENPQELWTAIVAAWADQHPELAAKLIDTGAQRLVYATAIDMKAGIGLAEEDPAALDKAQWRGTNWLGIAFETIRARLKDAALAEGGAAAAGGAAVIQQGGGERKYTEHGKTAKEEQEERGKWIGIQRFRGRGN